jgi:hypothetical protein
VAARFLIACLISLTVAGVVKSSVESSAGANAENFLYTVAPIYEPLSWTHGAERFPAGATIWVSDAKGRHALAPQFAASADPAVSFDGQRVSFAGRQKAEDRWQIWELTLANGAVRRVTSGAEDCIRPLYLPEERLVYARKTAGRFAIEVMDLAGSKPLALTYGPANYLPTDILRDGRILFEAGYPLGSDAIPEIYTVYSDGSGVESYRCDHGKKHDQGRQIRSGDILFGTGSGLARFTSARAQEVPIAAPAGNYAGDVVETSNGDWLLPWRRDAIKPFQLVRWTPGAGALRPDISEQNANAIQPVMLGARAVPNWHPSGLHDWPNANLLCLNAYTSKYTFPPGSIHSVRMYARDSSGAAKLLGVAPVERDGSFFVQVPTETALRIELLDDAGKTLQREAGFFWMRRGEQRVCVGCHAGPETAPENAVPMILLKSTTPADMTGARPRNASGGR